MPSNHNVGTAPDERLGQPTGAPAGARRPKLLLQSELGAFLKATREDLPGRVTQAAVAKAAGWQQSSYADIERGSRSSGDVRAWVAIAAILQCDPADILRRVWEIRGTLPLQLPDTQDARRNVVLRLAVEQAGTPDVLLAVREKPEP